MIIHREYAQQSQEWIEAHCGVATAGSFDALVTPKFELRTGEMPKTYVARKLAEAWCGPLPDFRSGMSWQMEQGTILEGEAIPFAEFEYGWSVERVGFCTTDDGRIGCSPDGLIGEDGGLEIKCPEAQTHVKYLLNGVLPPDYAAQVYGSLYVTGRAWWTFLSYRRHMPPLVIRVNRDDEIMAKLDEALTWFKEKFDEGMVRLIELNGGNPPPKRIPMVFSDDVRAREPEIADVPH